jgi:hypothetical protein
MLKHLWEKPKNGFMAATMNSSKKYHVPLSIEKVLNSLDLQKENITTNSSYYLCSITQNQTSHSLHILDMVINNLQHNIHKKDNKTHTT